MRNHLRMIRRTQFYLHMILSMGLIQLIWLACLGLGKKGKKITGTQARTSVPLVYNILILFLYIISRKSLNADTCVPAVATLC